ncbi:MAG: UDP-N-acetylmuramoyl-tripeptide--D-alanyl-D-alanine ligase [Legionellaceae bacterium]|nr:UDP-N-acetylmuramoyl-tripeptide--D-alanyl-D-alanine ligase [Legionellaceae bacterium]MBP9775229.1 UDP-N-acetylmuramoyl-tripeptide--D-alanyl-D-alanine ligase [Legionellaceae bacterium]
MNLSDIARVLNVSFTLDCVLSGISIDSRKVKPGDLFVALRGERFDGHDYIVAAARSGAIAVICEQSLQDVTIEQLVVTSSVEALAAIATWYRQEFTCPIIAVTGSNGKTSVKEMIAHILPQPSLATAGNLNNHIGVPLSIFQLQPEHRYAVFELGANHIGEIAYTVAMIQPQVALINNIAPAHIEGFGSIEGVAQAKGEIYKGLSTGGIAVVNDDDTYAHFWDETIASHPVIRFSQSHAANVWASDVVLNASGCAEFTLNISDERALVCLKVPGLHSVSNALAAAACTHALGISLSDIKNGLASFTGVSGRMMFFKGKKQATIIDDTYNANLRSTLAAVQVLANCSGVRILVLGDMAELGAWSEQHHEAVGIAAREQRIDGLLTCGKLGVKSALAFGSGGKHYTNQHELTEDLLRRLDSDTTVLVKGSRSAAMENIVQELI